MLVSILLPARNAEATLGACLRSIQRQSLTDWECVLINDGSDDATRTIALHVADADPRVRVLNTTAQGLVAALQQGLARCRGELVARMDADDVMHRDRLEMQVAALQADSSLAAVGCHVRIFPRRALTDGRRAYESWLNSMRSWKDIQRDAFVECPIAHPALMARRETLVVLGYRDAPWAEDYDLVLRMLFRGDRLGIVPRRLVAWRDGGGRLSRVDPRYSLEHFTECKAEFLARGFLAAHDTFVLWGYGDTGKALARALTSHGKRPSHIVEVHPGRIGQRIGGAPVVGLDALPSLRGRALLVSVAGATPRAEIREHLASLGFIETIDFLCAA